jgi:transcription elongation GreA/GreB family factor
MRDDFKCPISPEKLEEYQNKIQELKDELKKVEKEMRENVELDGTININDIKSFSEKAVFHSINKLNYIDKEIYSLRAYLSKHEVMEIHPPNTTYVQTFSIVEFKILSEPDEPQYIIEIVRHGDENPDLSRYSCHSPIVKSMIGLEEEFDEEIMIQNKEITIRIHKLYNKWPEDVPRGRFADYLKKLNNR